MTSVQLRTAELGDVEKIALLHADSWRRHYRGAYLDSFLDGDVVENRRSVWSERFTARDGTATIVAEGDTEFVGFVHVIFDSNERWGSLVDNLHVTHGSQRSGVGRLLMTAAAEQVVTNGTSKAMYLWVLEQNTAAQQFYRALSGRHVETDLVSAHGAVSGVLNGSPRSFRIAWPDASSLSGEGASSR